MRMDTSRSNELFRNRLQELAQQTTEIDQDSDLDRVIQMSIESAQQEEERRRMAGIPPDNPPHSSHAENGTVIVILEEIVKIISVSRPTRRNLGGVAQDSIGHSD